METKLAMIVLAGGASSRMGREKSDLLLNGRTFLETQIAKGKQLGVNRIYVSGYHGEGCTEEIVMDRIKERGPLGGLEACLSKAAGDGADRCLVLGVDTPLVPVSELQNIIQSASADDQNRVTLLRHNGKEESLMAVYETSLSSDIRAFLERGQASVFRFLNEIGYSRYDTQEDDRYFTNINDPKVYEEVSKENFQA